MQHLFLEKQINTNTVIHPLQPGYPIDSIVVKVPSLHGMFKWFKSTTFDFCLNSAKSGPRKVLSATLLALISPSQTWLSFFYAWMLKKIVAKAEAWSNAPPLARQARVLMYTIIATCRLRSHTPARLIQLGVACQLLNPFMQSQAHLLHPPSGVTASTNKNKKRDLTTLQTLWKHMVMLTYTRAHTHTHF